MGAERPKFLVYIYFESDVSEKQKRVDVKMSIFYLTIYILTILNIYIF